MKKNLLFSLVLTLYCFFSYSQQTVNIPLAKGETILDFAELKDGGFIIKTGKDGYYTKNLSWKLSYFTKDLEKKWEAPLETQQMNKNHGEDLVASPSGSYVYHLENADNNFTMGTSSYKVSQINKTGKIKTFELKAKDVYEYSSMKRMLYLCDDDFFYIVSVEEQSRNYPAKLHYYKIKHSDLKSSQVKIDLPAASDNRWEYAGHTDQYIWLANIEVDQKNNTNQVDLVKVSWAGKLEGTIKTVNNPLNGLYPTTHLNYNYSLGTKFNENYKIEGLSVKGNWTQVLVDEKNNMLYSFGFYNTKKNNGNAANISGNYVFAYDLNGKLLWKQISDESDIMFEDKLFGKRLNEQQRNIFAYLTSDNGLRLQIPSNDHIYTYDFSKKGNKTQFANTFEEHVLEYLSKPKPHFELNTKYFFYCLPANIPSAQYYSKSYAKKKSFYTTTQPIGDILIECDEKAGAKLLKW